MSGKMCIFAASKETEKSNSMKRLIRLSAVWVFFAITSCTSYCWGQLASQELNHPQETGKIGGSYQNNAILYQTWQSFQYTYTFGDETYWETCYMNLKGNTCDLTPLPELTAISGGVSCHDGLDIDWRSYILNAEACETDTVCNDIYETKQ